MSENWRASQLALWANDYDWPVDHSGFEFLPRALRRLGVGIYQGSWRGDELGVDAKFSSPQMPNRVRGYQPENVRTLHALISAHRPNMALKPLPPYMVQANVVTNAPAPFPTARSGPVAPRPSIASATSAQRSLAAERVEAGHLQTPYHRTSALAAPQNRRLNINPRSGQLSADSVEKVRQPFIWTKSEQCHCSRVMHERDLSPLAGVSRSN